MIDDTTRERQKAARRAYAKARYQAHRKEILARKRKRDASLFTGAKACPTSTHHCLECGAEMPEEHHPVDFCDWREYRAHFKREYQAIEVASLPHAAPRRK